ncbi:unnamed protein product [Zymoseptoria tritici ST99CH_3D1]|uniref:Uncharacterized protein n=2 Tax=Zymoseptoria tritici TaxID=1047171 RepID=F9WY59_ZYMTI|nr:uncharacterized protein MYCGRDRAFT_89574 [Zymoseptoria tritici IPO323]EGP91371.1 hypothetical protein MYCGRDRAFT_89574 [Zymoseptoria tritici IPO323]SMR42449.1 unnamed protein product [Zymoseptoria tritici ST99CH_1E4]SMR44627.1 unnamed protein product [Zymoseptoria tritici ST99CH_3D1]
MSQRHLEVAGENRHALIPDEQRKPSEEELDQDIAQPISPTSILPSIEAQATTQSPAENPLDQTLLNTAKARASQAPGSVFAKPILPASTYSEAPDRRDSNRDDEPQHKRRKTEEEGLERQGQTSLPAARAIIREGTPMPFTVNHPRHGATTYRHIADDDLQSRKRPDLDLRPPCKTHVELKGLKRTIHAFEEWSLNQTLSQPGEAPWMQELF